MKKIFLIVVLCLVAINFVGCSSKSDENNKNTVSENIKSEKNVDYSKYFDGINGCAVFYDDSNRRYDIYNRDIINEQVSPYSTFKIVMSLMGLEENIVDSSDTKLGYDGTIYWNEKWNKNITFEEGFRESCVWYYEKMMDSMDKEYVKNKLEDLNYGNCDISAWDENGHNKFWLGSSLKISAMEQVNLLESIFKENDGFKKEDIETVKNFMLVKSEETYSVYGKTGSARDTHAWFVGFVEKNDRNIYFAARIDDESQKLAGSIAKQIALEIIKENYN